MICYNRITIFMLRVTIGVRWDPPTTAMMRLVSHVFFIFVTRIYRCLFLTVLKYSTVLYTVLQPRYAYSLEIEQSVYCSDQYCGSESGRNQTFFWSEQDFWVRSGSRRLRPDPDSRLQWTYYLSTECIEFVKL
jgi:hypothetical protein